MPFRRPPGTILKGTCNPFQFMASALELSALFQEGSAGNECHLVNSNRHNVDYRG